MSKMNRMTESVESSSAVRVQGCSFSKKESASFLFVWGCSRLISCPQSGHFTLSSGISFPQLLQNIVFLLFSSILSPSHRIVKSLVKFLPLTLIRSIAAGRIAAVRSVRRTKNKERRRERFRKEVVSPFGFVISRNICGYQLTASYRSIIFDLISFS